MMNDLKQMARRGLNSLFFLLPSPHEVGSGAGGEGRRTIREAANFSLNAAGFPPHPNPLPRWRGGEVVREAATRPAGQGCNNALFCALLCCLLFALSSCTLAPKHEPPEMPAPEKLPVAAASGGAEQAAVDEIGWAEFYLDPTLRRVIAATLDNNRDLRAAALNVETFQAQYRIQRAQLFPEIDAAGGWSRQRSFSAGQYGTGEMYNVSVGLTAWELDLFGRVRSLKEAALERYFAQEENYRAARIALIAETARAWLSLLADRELLAISQDTLAGEQESFGLVQQRFDGGIANNLELAQSRTLLEQVRGSLAQYELQGEQDKNALNLLAGASLADLDAGGQRLEDHDLTLRLPADLPSTVLLRRPDIQAAEHELKAANADIGAARAAFFPAVRLTANAGYMAPDFDDLFDSKTSVWAFMPSVSLPIFTAGRLKAQLDVAELRKEAAVVNYEKAIQTAFREVADALAAQKWLAERVAAQKAYVEACRQYYDLAVARYQEGIDSFLTQLDAQRTLFAARQAYVTLRLAQQSNQVNLFKALGGGWKE